jgi:hypothetical protein
MRVEGSGIQTSTASNLRWLQPCGDAGKREAEVLDDILFCSSVVMFATAAILAYWQILRAQAGKAAALAEVSGEAVPVLLIDPMI